MYIFMYILFTCISKNALKDVTRLFCTPFLNHSPDAHNARTMARTTSPSLPRLPFFFPLPSLTPFLLPLPLHLAPHSPSS